MTDDSEEQATISDRAAGWPFRVPLAVALIGGVTLLILLAVGSVLIVTLSGASENTFSLLGQRAATTLDLLDARIAGQLGPVENAGTDLGAQFADGRLNLGERRERAFDTFRGVFATLPQVTAVIFVPVEGEALRTTIREGFVIEVPSSPQLLRRQRFALEGAYQQPGPEWSPPFWVQAVNRAVVTYLVPVRRGDEFLGVVAVSVRLDKIARFLETLEQEENLSGFILYDRASVLGHPRLLEAEFRSGGDLTDNPLPAIADVPEPAFRLLSGASPRLTQLLDNAPTISDARFDDEFIIITRDLHRYGAAPWTLGLKLRRAEVGGEVVRLQTITIIGVVILIVAVVAGYLFARLLNHQISRLTQAAETVGQLDIAHVPRVPNSPLSELARAAQAFNAMVGALRWFEAYVPKSLVLRLMQRADEVAHSQEREVTVMFTDITGFSTLAEDMSAEETASLLNAHFELLSGCIEAEGGTVDKFIGDSVMAFWGAPEPAADHAARALRAAAAIQRAIPDANFRRTARDRLPISVRVGVHTGRVVVGNIGSHSRLNYTVVGDAVNIASRLEALPKELGLYDECVVLVSKEARDSAGDEFGADSGVTFEEAGEHAVRGRTQKVTVYRLIADGTQRSPAVEG